MKTKAIRSLRLANELVASGHKILNVVPSYHSERFKVFIFEDTSELQRLLSRSRAAIPPNKAFNYSQ